MALKKFIKIENVGRLVACSQKGPELKRYNLLFAENGRGKTTLCSVLRSFETGQPEHIAERKTLSPSAGDPVVEIRQDGGDAYYQKNAWNKSNKDIVIFDSTFVAQNVHAGEFVDRSHRANLLQVIIGEAGVKLAATVNGLDAQIREHNSKIAAAKKALESQNLNGTTLSAFLEIVDDPDIDKKISDKEAEVSAAQVTQLIKDRSALKELTIPELPADFMITLSKTIADVEKSAEQKIQDQINKHAMHDKGEVWLSEGLGYIQNDDCPFCGQNTKGSELLPAYKQYFSESYEELKIEIQNLISKVENQVGTSFQSKASLLNASNTADIEFWKKYTALKIEPLDIDTNVIAPLVAIAEAAQNLVAHKLAKPLEEVVPAAVFNAAINDLAKVATLLNRHNIDIKAANLKIEEKRNSALTSSLAKVEKELQALNVVKLRYAAKVKPLCDEYQKLTLEKVKLDADKDAAKLALDAHADTMIKDYQTTINNILVGFGAGFSLTNSKKTYIGGKPTSAYQILINNHPVDLGDGTTPIGQPSFRTTLSAGDKSTLALAFFLAKLDHDASKASRIIIFDDPFNSQDRSRRERTAELLKKYGSECHQMILLSHDPFFLSLVHSKLPKNQTHCLQLSRVPGNQGVVAGGYSTLEEWDLEKETQDGYFKEHAALNSYMLNGSKDYIDTVRKIRPVLEGYLRYRFPNQFSATNWLGDMIGTIRNDNTHPMHNAHTDLAEINDYSKKYHHDTNPGKADSELIDDGELQTYVDRTLKIVGGY